MSKKGKEGNIQCSWPRLAFWSISIRGPLRAAAAIYSVQGLRPIEE
jgi:hypothetical protein